MKIIIKKLSLTLLVYSLLVSVLSANQSTQVITVWNYYQSPPFAISKNEGLAIDLVNLLNKKLQNKFIFKLTTLPRSRLNQLLEVDKQGIVLFANWIWMGKDSKNKYLWTPALIQDRNEIISSINKKIIFNNPESLKGLKFGAIRGRKYKGFKELFANNEIKKYNLNRERQALEMIVMNRIDVTSQPRTIALSLIKDLGIEDKIFFSPKPLFSFTRYIMISKELKNLHIDLSLIIQNLEKDDEWKIILEKYNLN